MSPAITYARFDHVLAGSTTHEQSCDSHQRTFGSQADEIGSQGQPGASGTMGETGMRAA